MILVMTLATEQMTLLQAFRAKLKRRMRIFLTYVSTNHHTLWQGANQAMCLGTVASSEVTNLLELTIPVGPPVSVKTVSLAKGFNIVLLSISQAGQAFQ